MGSPLRPTPHFTVAALHALHGACPLFCGQAVNAVCTTAAATPIGADLRGGEVVRGERHPLRVSSCREHSSITAVRVRARTPGTVTAGAPRGSEVSKASPSAPRRLCAPRRFSSSCARPPGPTPDLPLRCGTSSSRVLPTGHDNGLGSVRLTHQGAATCWDTHVGPTGAKRLHALARPRSVERDELPRRGREVRGVGERSEAWEEPWARRKGFRRLGGTSGVDEELPARPKSLSSPTKALPRGRRASQGDEGPPARTTSFPGRRRPSRGRNQLPRATQALPSGRRASQGDEGPPASATSFRSRTKSLLCGRRASQGDAGPPERTKALPCGRRASHGYEGPPARRCGSACPVVILRHPVAAFQRPKGSLSGEPWTCLNLLIPQSTCSTRPRAAPCRGFLAMHPTPGSLGKFTSRSVGASAPSPAVGARPVFSSRSVASALARVASRHLRAR